MIKSPLNQTGMSKSPYWQFRTRCRRFENCHYGVVRIRDAIFRSLLFHITMIFELEQFTVKMKWCYIAAMNTHVIDCFWPFCFYSLSQSANENWLIETLKKWIIFYWIEQNINMIICNYASCLSKMGKILHFYSFLSLIALIT